MIARAWRSTLRRLPRVALSLASLAAGGLALVAIVSLSGSAAASIRVALGGLQPSMIAVTVERDEWWTDARLAKSLSGIGAVQSSGSYTVLPDDGGVRVAAAVGGQVLAPEAVVIASRSGLAAVGAVVREGGVPGDGAAAADVDTVVVGVAFARSVGVSVDEGQNTLVLNGRVVTVTGLATGGGDAAVVSRAIVLSPGLAKSLGVVPGRQSIAVVVDRGTAPAVAALLHAAFSPEDPDAVSASYAPSAAGFVGQVSSGTQQLVVIVGALAGVMAILSIVTTMQIAVWERRSEIGVMRAIGFRRSAVALQFVCESALIGAIGTGAGWVAGVLVSAGVAKVAGFDLYFDPVLFAVPLLGAVLGVVAGVVPAIRASRLDPAVLLRS